MVSPALVDKLLELRLNIIVVVFGTLPIIEVYVFLIFKGYRQSLIGCIPEYLEFLSDTHLGAVGTGHHSHLEFGEVVCVIDGKQVFKSYKQK